MPRITVIAGTIAVGVLALAATPAYSAPRVLPKPVRVVEGDAGTKKVRVVLRLTGRAPAGARARFRTLRGTAGAGDFQARSGTVRFRRGSRRTVVTLRIRSDRLDEPDERFSLRLSGSRRLRLGRARSVRITIVDDDSPTPAAPGGAPPASPPPIVSVGDAGAPESDAAATVPVTLSAPSGRPVSVIYATQDGTADGADHPVARGTVRFDPGVTNAAVAVPITDDLRDEDAQSFAVSLEQPDGVTIGDGDATVTIADDDAAPTLSIDDLTLSEANTTAAFSVTLSAPSEKAVSVRADTVDGSATGASSCASGVDYVAISDLLVAFNPGDVSQPLAVAVCEDVTPELNEQATVTLSQLVNATPGDLSGRLTILDDD